MMPHMRVPLAFIVATCLFTIIASLHADSLPMFTQKPVVIAGTSDENRLMGTIYAKSVPAPEQHIGTNGSTVVYRVGANLDAPLHRFPWFAARLELAIVKNSICVVQPGLWSPGDRARSNHVAFTLYCDGRLVREYNTLELSGSPTNVRPSTSHYTWAKEFIGFRYLMLSGNKTYRYVFAIRHVDGRILCFDPITGAQLANALPDQK